VHSIAECDPARQQAQPGLSETKSGVNFTAASRISLPLNPGYLLFPQKPAQFLAHRSRAALGIMLTGITTGPEGAFPGLGQAGAGNARLAARSLSPPGWGELDKTMRSCHVPGSLAWSCAQRAKAPTARAVVERRQASASARRAPRASAEDGHIRLPAFRFLFCSL